MGERLLIGYREIFHRGNVAWDMHRVKPVSRIFAVNSRRGGEGEGEKFYKKVMLRTAAEIGALAAVNFTPVTQRPLQGENVTTARVSEHISPVITLPRSNNPL